MTSFKILLQLQTAMYCWQIGILKISIYP